MNDEPLKNERMTARTDDLYERDFYAWTKAQASALRRLGLERPNLPLDLEHLAEEILGLGKSERDAAFSFARLIMQHLLLLGWSPAMDQRPHWTDEIDEFRAQLALKLTPRLRNSLRTALPRLYAIARKLVDGKMRRHGEAAAADRLPTACPYTLDQIVDDWFPDKAGAG